MPHQIIEYTDNLETQVDIEELVRAMHEAAAGIDALPTAGLRTRAAKRKQYLVADGDPENAFVNVTLRIATGRPPEVRRAIGDKLFAVLERCTEAYSGKRPIALSLEIQEIDPEFRWKSGTIREHMARRAN